MGWISQYYNDATQQNFNPQKAYDFCKQQFESNGYQIKDFWFQKAKPHDNHVVYAVFKHPEGYNFIEVILLNIKNNEIYYKNISASMGPTEDKCPVEFLGKVPMPTQSKNDYKFDWFIKVRKRNVKYKKQEVNFY